MFVKPIGHDREQERMGLFHPRYLLLVAIPVTIYWAMETPEAPPPQLSDVPNLNLVRYDVSGKTAKEIRASLNANGPWVEDYGRRFDALADWNFYWDWPGYGSASCDLTKAEVTFKAKVVFPRLVGLEKLDPALQSKWTDYVSGLATHEAGHFSYAYERQQIVEQAIANSNCSEADRAAQDAVALLAANDPIYDRATNHGATQGAMFP